MNNISIVTAFFDIGRGDWTPDKGLPHYLERKTETYLERFGYLTNLKNDITVFTTEDLAPKVQEICKNRTEKTNIVILDLNERFSKIKEDISINRNPELTEKGFNKIIKEINKIKPIIPKNFKIRDLFKFYNNNNYKTVEPPLFKKTRFNERFELYNNIKSNLNKEKIISNNCLQIPKISDIKYIINKNIILEKQIGSPSVMGTIFLSHYKNDVNNKFATKFADPIFPPNMNEYEILKELSEIVLTEQIPHFPLTYGHLLCYNDYNSNSDNRTRLIITYNELANGDYKMFYKKFYDNDKLILNAFAQIFISIMFFEYYLSMFQYIICRHFDDVLLINNFFPYIKCSYIQYIAFLYITILNQI
jgi:hypothetical protein